MDITRKNANNEQKSNDNVNLTKSSNARRRPVFNPYAPKKKTPPKTLLPTTTTATTTTQTTTTTRTTNGNTKTISQDDISNDTSIITPGPQQSANHVATTSHHQQDQEEDQEKKASAKKQHKNSVFGKETPLHERLPSFNVTFQSCEILSVSELSLHLQHYNDKSVRITGVVLHRLTHPQDDYIYLILGDPLLGAHPNLNQLRTRPVTGATTPARYGTAALAKKHTMTKTSSPPKEGNIVTQTPKSSLSSCISTPAKKTTPRRIVPTPLASKRATPLKSSTATLPQSTINNRSKLLPTPRKLGKSFKTPVKRKLVASATKNLSAKKSPTIQQSNGGGIYLSPVEMACNTLANENQRQPSLVLIVIHSPSMPRLADGCGVGDLVMAMGEVSDCADHIGGTIWQKLQQQNHHLQQNGRSQICPRRQGRLPRLHLSPRILKNVNGTNVRLQYEVLKLRRQCLIQRQEQQQQQCNAQSGLGPPTVSPIPPTMARCKSPT